MTKNRPKKFDVVIGAIVMVAFAGFVQAQDLLDAADLTSEASTQTGSFPLGPRDQIRLRVGQWAPTEGIYVPWPDFGGEYLVGSNGMLSLPLIGAIKATGRSPEEIANEISAELYTKAGLVEPPSVSIEVIEYRPVYIIGATKQQGAFSFVPGLTVLQAVGLAGGVDRVEPRYSDGQRNAVSALGDYEVLRLSLWRNLAQRARVEAELSGSDNIAMPQRLSEAPIADELIAVQLEIKAVNDLGVRSGLEQIKSLEDLIQRQIKQLDARITLRDEQVELARQELASVDQLVGMGLSVTSRQTSVARIVADLESGLLELETAKLQAEQQLTETRRDQLDLVNEHRRTLLSLLEQTRSQVVEIEKRMETAKALFATASRSERLDDMTAVGEPIFTITRRTRDGFATTLADGATELLPEDVLEVEVPLLDGLLAPSRRQGSIGNALSDLAKN